MPSNRTDHKHELDPETKEFFKNKPVWYVTTLVMCEKCGKMYKASIGHKSKNCVSVEIEEE